MPRVHACFEAGALATGATLTIEPTRIPYTEFEADVTLTTMYKANGETLERTFAEPSPGGGGSTDMANLSLLMPTIHPMLGLTAGDAVNHQVEFAELCRTDEADQALLDGAVAMAWTTVDAALDSATRQRLLDGDTDYGQRQNYPWTLDL